MPEVVEDITLQHTAMTGAAQSQVRNRRELEETIGALQKVQKAHSMATELKEKATQATSPAERERLLSEAFEKETEAHGHSKMARRMQSGTWQGLFGGGGIGVGVGMGLGQSSRLCSGEEPADFEVMLIFKRSHSGDVVGYVDAN